MRWFPAIADLAFYATMRVEGRFRAGYTIALFAACIAPLRITDLPNSAEFTGAVALAVSSVLFAQAGVEAGHEAISGDRVGYMGDALSDHGWVYVAGVEIAAEIPLEDTLSFWGADREQRDEALNGLAEERAIRTTTLCCCRKCDEQNSSAERVTAAPVLQAQKRRLAAALQQ